MKSESTVPRPVLFRTLRAAGHSPKIDCFGGIRFSILGRNVIIHANTKPHKRSPFIATHGFVVAPTFLEAARAAKAASQLTGLQISGHPKFGHAMSVTYVAGKLESNPVKTQDPKGTLP